MAPPNKTVSWTAGNGAAIKIEAADYLDSAVAYASVNGKHEVGSKPIMLDAPLKFGDNVVVARIGNVGLTQERLDQVLAAMAAVQDEINARPEVKMRKLIAQRRALAEKIGYVMDAAHEAHVALIETTSAQGFAMRSPRDFAADEKAARARLAEFDSAHPEVIAKIEADRADAAARFLATD